MKPYIKINKGTLWNWGDKIKKIDRKPLKAPARRFILKNYDTEREHFKKSI